MTQLAHWWWTIISIAFVETTVVALAVLVVVSLGRKLPAPLRHALLLIALLKFAIPPGLIVVSVPASVIETVVPQVSIPVDAGDRWKVWLMVAHATGALVVLASLFIRLSRLRALVRRARVIASDENLRVLRFAANQIGLKRTPRLLVIDECIAPISFGILRPTVLVPQHLLDRLDAEGLRVVFAHELVHHRRGDLLICHLQAWLLPLWWFNPLFRLVSHAIERVREEACDDFLLARRLTTDEAYCSLLLDAASSVSPRSFAIPATAMAGHPLHRRIRRIMASQVVRRERISPLMRVALIVAGAFVLTTFQASELTSEPAPVIHRPIDAQQVVPVPSVKVRRATSSPIPDVITTNRVVENADALKPGPFVDIAKIEELPDRDRPPSLSEEIVAMAHNGASEKAIKAHVRDYVARYRPENPRKRRSLLARVFGSLFGPSSRSPSPSPSPSPSRSPSPSPSG